MSIFSRTDNSFLGRWWWTVDRRMLFCFLILMILGVLMISTASPPVAQSHHLATYYFLKKHVMLLAPSFLILLGTSMMSVRMVWRSACAVLGLSLVAMIFVLFVGIEIKGAQRWLHLPGFSFQPSEFAKPSFAIVSAWLMSRHKGNSVFSSYLATIGLYCVVILLLMLQPDLGMSFVVTSILVAQIFLAGSRFRIIAGLVGFGAGGLCMAYLLFDHVRSRVDRFLKPDSGDNYQVERSLEAFQAGGIFGAGPGQGTVKQALPDAHADFIFSVAGEEMGLVFILIIIALFAFVVLRGLNRLMESESMFSVLAAGGLLTMLGLQAMIHMGSAMNILPAKGMTLPFISYGGSSILSLGFSMGVVLALTRRRARSSIARGGMATRTMNATEAEQA